jgi:Ca2+-binding EF-hand superfamily protein
MIKVTFLLASLLMFMSQVVLADSGNEGMDKGHKGKKEHGMKSVMVYADINGDGDITFEEFQRTKYQYFNYKFLQLDENRDGVVTEREFMESHRTKGDELFNKMDLDGNGVISQSEREEAKGGMQKGKQEGCMHQGDDQE